MDTSLKLETPRGLFVKLALLSAMLAFIACTQLFPVVQDDKGNTPSDSVPGASKPGQPKIADVLSVVRASADADGQSHAKANGLLTEGRLDVTVMELATSPRVAELSLRMKAALQQDAEWFMQYAQAHSGQALPYNSRFGISSSEYQELMAGNAQAKYREVAKAVLSVAETGSGKYVLNGGSQLPEVSGIVIDLENDQVVTEYGVLDDKKVINAPDTTALGAWRGIQWKLAKASSTYMLTSDFALGKLSQSGKCVLLYDVKKINSDGSKIRIDRVLTFEANHEQTAFSRSVETLLR